MEGSLFGAALFLIRGTGKIKDDTTSRSSLSAVDVILRLDPVGIVLCVPGLVFLIFSLTSGNTTGWNSVSIIATLTTAIAFLVAFVLFEAYLAEYPLVPRHLWIGSNLAVGCVLAACAYGVWQGTNYILTLQLQGRENYFRRPRL